MAPIAEASEEIVDQEDDNNSAHEPDVTGIAEARCPPTMSEPHLPSKSERIEHERTHIPYRNWCPICVEAEAREDAHRKDAADKEGEQLMPTIAFDYDFYGEGLSRKARGEAPEDTEVTAFVMKDCKSGSIWAHTARCKGPKDVWLMKCRPQCDKIQKRRRARS